VSRSGQLHVRHLRPTQPRSHEDIRFHRGPVSFISAVTESRFLVATACVLNQDPARRMISFRVGEHRFHYRAAAIARQGNHLLLHRLAGEDFWALPGGRVNPGEEARNTIVREFLEELQVQVECLELVSVGENFFRHDGEPHHEVGFYFSVRIAPSSPIANMDTTHHGVEGSKPLEFRWFALSELLSIDMRPQALQQALASDSVPLHFVQRDRNAA
jgi:ADP-ribose pyrophosphatase YjhB (NUDIX family)